MANKILQGSRYENITQFIEADGKAIFIPARRPIATTDYADNIVHTVLSKDRVDLISSKYYGTPQYGWVIADFNDLLFPDGDGPHSLQSKDTIILPSISTLTDKILV